MFYLFWLWVIFNQKAVKSCTYSGVRGSSFETRSTRKATSGWRCVIVQQSNWGPRAYVFWHPFHCVECSAASCICLNTVCLTVQPNMQMQLADVYKWNKVNQQASKLIYSEDVTHLQQSWLLSKGCFSLFTITVSPPFHYPQLFFSFLISLFLQMMLHSIRALFSLSWFKSYSCSLSFSPCCQAITI